MRSIINKATYNDHVLSRTRKNNQGFYEEVLQKIEVVLGHMIQKHNQVFFIRFDLHYPAGANLNYPDDNVLFSKFIEALARHCRNKSYDPHYIWAREYSKTGLVHYHLVLLLDADYIQNAHVLITETAPKQWQRTLESADAKGLVNLSKLDKFSPGYYGGGIKIKRKGHDFQQVYANCYELASYLAKCYSKGDFPANVRGYDSSRLT